MVEDGNFGTAYRKRGWGKKVKKRNRWRRGKEAEDGDVRSRWLQNKHVRPRCVRAIVSVSVRVSHVSLSPQCGVIYRSFLPNHDFCSQMLSKTNLGMYAGSRASHRVQEKVSYVSRYSCWLRLALNASWTEDTLSTAIALLVLLTAGLWENCML